MSFGLRVRNEGGQVTLDNVDNVGRLLATVQFPDISGTNAVTVQVPGLDPSRIAYSLNQATHTHLIIEFLAGAVRATLTRADASVGTTQPAFSINLIFTS